eukprot:497151-Rhodomonas_salina.1
MRHLQGEEERGLARNGVHREKERWKVMGRALREEEKGSNGEWMVRAQREEERRRERANAERGQGMGRALREEEKGREREGIMRVRR